MRTHHRSLEDVIFLFVDRVIVRATFEAMHEVFLLLKFSGIDKMIMRLIIIIMSVFHSANFNSDKSPCSKALMISDNTRQKLEKYTQYDRLALLLMKLFYSGQMKSTPWLLSHGPRLNIKTIWIQITSIKWSWDRPIFMMGIPILIREHIYIESDPRPLVASGHRPQWHLIWRIKRALSSTTKGFH